MENKDKVDIVISNEKRNHRMDISADGFIGVSLESVKEDQTKCGVLIYGSLSGVSTATGLTVLLEALAESFSPALVSRVLFEYTLKEVAKDMEETEDENCSHHTDPSA